MPEESIQSKGGKARAEKLSPQRRRELARMAARARWDSAPNNVEDGQEEKISQTGVPIRASHAGVVNLDGLELQCAVVEDGKSIPTRVISERAVTRALGGKRGGSHWKRLQASEDGAYLPVYLSANNLRLYIPPSLAIALSQPIIYKPPKGSRPAYGLDATLLAEVCETFLRARDAGVLTRSQEPIAAKADILMRSLARVGIVALIDAATGYEKVRDRKELEKLLEMYVSKELLPWTKRFPDEFYDELFRLQGWQFNPMTTRKPRLIGRLTAELIYEQLPDGVLEKLREKAPSDENGRRRHKLHQSLTEEIGHPALEKQVSSVTALMRASPNRRFFKKLFERAFPKRTGQAQLPGFEEIDDDMDDP